MGQRTDLHAKLKELLESENVYFQPPPDANMSYPAITYQLDGSDTTHADNAVYFNTRRYQITYIDRRPDSEVYDKLIAFPLTKFARRYKAANLNHDVFNTYY